MKNLLLLSARVYTGGYMTTSSGQVNPTGGGGVYGQASSIEIPLVAVYGYLTFIDPSNGEKVWSEVKRTRWTAGHTVHAIFNELRKRIWEHESVKHEGLVLNRNLSEE